MDSTKSTLVHFESGFAGGPRETEASPLLARVRERAMATDIAPEKAFQVDTRSTSTIDGESSGKDDPSNRETKLSDQKPPWWSYIWDFEPGRSKEETAFLRRLDTSVLIILSLGYFIKNLDQTNIGQH